MTQLNNVLQAEKKELISKLNYLFDNLAAFSYVFDEVEAISFDKELTAFIMADAKDKEWAEREMSLLRHAVQYLEEAVTALRALEKDYT